MPFNVALSGIRAASKDLSITGNNIANASTVGFKSSRAEFGELYATTVLGSGSNSIGSGVRLQEVKHNFSQGNVTFTEKELDLAINGNGMFMLNRDGEALYSRAGTFGLDEEGYIVNNVGGRLQGYPANASGEIGGLRGDLRVQTTNLSPRQTTDVESQLNLDSAEPVLQSVGQAFETTGNSIAVTQAGLQDATTTTLTGSSFTLPMARDFSTSSVIFDVQLSGASSGNNGTVTVNLDTSEGVPANINSFNDLRTLAGVINSQLLTSSSPVDVVATAVDEGGGNYRLDLSAVQEGEGSQIQVSDVNNAADLGLTATTLNTGVPQVTNGYPAQEIDVIDPDGDTVTYTSGAGASAASTASELNALAGVSATANTRMQLLASGYNNAAGNMVITLNGVSLTSDSLADLEQEVNRLSTSSLPGISADLDAVTGDLTITSAVGDNLEVNMSSTDAGDAVEVIGNPDAPSETLEQGVNATTDAVIVGGSIELVLEEGYTVENANPPAIGLFGPITPDAFEQVVINEFDPNDQATYNSATTMTVYDSLGNAHEMTQYFVRQEYDPTDPTTSPNHWQMHVTIDGRNVGDPDTTLPAPQNTQPTMATYNLHFNDDGSLNSGLSDEVLISNWTPRDENGESNGAMGPLNVLAGGNSTIPEPPSSSNFVIDLTGTTQYNDVFSVNNVDQDGYTTGRLSGMAINEDGVIFARFTNGESQALGQILLADFANEQGLQPVGDTMWAENFESGPPNVGTPGSANLGALQAGALEESNVDLSEQLVNLIVAQRNFQASAKTIETADQTTQTIINLR